MKRLKRIFFTTGLLTLYAAFFSLAGVANALEIVLEPSSMQREIGDRVRVQIYADPAVDLISMGVKVSFGPAILEVVEAHKYEDFDNGWIMDADGVEAIPPDHYNTPAVEIDNGDPDPETGRPGSVTMIGGRLMGTTAAGLNGKVLLGWIIFEAVGLGTGNLTVNVAHTEATYDNFVSLNDTVGTPDEPTNVPRDLGAVLSAICVVADACLSDLTGDGVVNGLDVGVLKQEFLNTNCNDPGVWCKGDLNGDGVVNGLDVGVMKQDFLRIDCGCLIP